MYVILSICSNKKFTLLLWGVASISKSIRGVVCCKRLKTPELACIRTETKVGNILRVWCDCSMSRWDILQKLFVTLSNCLLSNKVKNAMVLGHDNYKIKKFKN